MSEMEEKLGAILSNPQLMQQIMSLAQAMDLDQKPKQEAPKPPAPQIPNLDPGLLRSLAGITRQSSVDQNQQALLKALSPYLSQNRVQKLERAMRAAKMASLASGFINSGALQLLTGR